MRLPSAFHCIAATAACLLVLATTASAGDACTEADPCPWVVDLDAQGFAAPEGSARARWNFTAGDWYVLNVTNWDEEAQVVVLDGHGIAIEVPALGTAETAPFNFSKPGSYQLRNGRGHTADVVVVAADVVDYEQGLVDDSGEPRGTASASTPPPQGSNGLGAPVAGALAALALVALRHRARRAS